MKLGRSHARLSEPTLHAFGEKIDKSGVIVGTGDLLKGLASCLQKRVTSLLLKLFERFKTVGGKRGRHD